MIDLRPLSLFSRIPQAINPFRGHMVIFLNGSYRAQRNVWMTDHVYLQYLSESHAIFSVVDCSMLILRGNNASGRK